MKIMRVTLENGRLPRSEMLATRLREVRESRGLYPGQFAGRLGVSRIATLQWENHRCQPSLAMIEKIAEVLAVTPEYLAFAVECPEPGPASSYLHEEIKF